MCDCPERPRCTFRWCDGYGAWSVPHWDGRLVFMCDWHHEQYDRAIKKPMPGISRPEGVPAEDYQPSLSGMIRLAAIRNAFDDNRKNARPAIDGSLLPRQRNYTPQQKDTLMRLRELSQLSRS